MFEDDSLFTPMESSRNTTMSSSILFINFINQLEGWKTKCKNLHWAAPRKNIHEYLDDFLAILSDYQDGLAEGYMGILGKMGPNVIEGVSCSANNAAVFIIEVKNATLTFYNKIPREPIYKGLTSECEVFIQNINKYDYLFHLCENV